MHNAAGEVRKMQGSLHSAVHNHAHYYTPGWNRDRRYSVDTSMFVTAS